MSDLVTLTTDYDMRVKASCRVIRVRSEIVISQLLLVLSFAILLFMLYGYLISNISNAKIGPLFYFTLNVEFLYNRLQSLLHKRMMINHSTLEYHVTNFNTFFRWLWRKNQNPKTLL